MEPRLIFCAHINIQKMEVDIKYWDVDGTLIESFPSDLLKKTEFKQVFAEEYKKGLSRNKIIEMYPNIPDERKNRLQMRDKILKTYNERYRRR